MRKITIFTLLLGVIFCFTLPNANSQIKLGVKAGMTFSNVTVTPTATTNSRMGIIIGGLAEFRLADMVYIQPELEYIMKGAEIVSGGVTYTWKFNYFQIPLYLKLKFPLQGSQFKPFVFAGPTFGFNLSANEDYSYLGQSGSNDIKSNIETLDMGLDFGAGGEFSVAPKMGVYGSVMYGLGLTNIIKNNPNLTVKNNGFKINVGLLFNL